MSDKDKWPYTVSLKVRALKLAQSYCDLVKEADDLLTQAPNLDGQPRGTSVGDPVAAAAMRREDILEKIEAVEDSVMDIEPWYRDGIRANLFYGVPLYILEGAAEKTWIRKRVIVLQGIVRRMGWTKTI